MAIVRQVLQSMSTPQGQLVVGAEYNDGAFQVMSLFASDNSYQVSCQERLGPKHHVTQMENGERRANISASNIRAIQDDEGAVIFPFSIQVRA